MNCTKYKVSMLNAFLLFIAMVLCILIGLYLGWISANLLVEYQLEELAQINYLETKVRSGLVETTRIRMSDVNLQSLIVIESHVETALIAQEADGPLVPTSLYTAK